MVVTIVEKTVTQVYNNSVTQLIFEANYAIIEPPVMIGGEQMSSLLERIALEVKERRQGMGMSQEELADKIDKSSSFIGQLERGESSLKLETFQMLVKCLGMDANALLSGEQRSRSTLNELYSLAAQMSEKEIKLLLGIAKLLHQSDV